MGTQNITVTLNHSIWSVCPFGGIKQRKSLVFKYEHEPVFTELMSIVKYNLEQTISQVRRKRFRSHMTDFHQSYFVAAKHMFSLVSFQKNSAIFTSSSRLTIFLMLCPFESLVLDTFSTLASHPREQRCCTCCPACGSPTCPMSPTQGVSSLPWSQRNKVREGGAEGTPVQGKDPQRDGPKTPEESHCGQRSDAGIREADGPNGITRVRMSFLQLL